MGGVKGELVSTFLGPAKAAPLVDLCKYQVIVGYLVLLLRYLLLYLGLRNLLLILLRWLITI